MSSTSSGTPFIALLEPTTLNWDKSLPASEQPNPSAIPRTFFDAMTVRTEVFVKEQGVPQENEFDDDDPRSAHWVIYASVNQTISPAVTDPETGRVLRPRQSETRSVPIGTLRLVPFPHPPHPKPGGEYWDGVLVNSEQDGAVANGNGNGTSGQTTADGKTTEQTPTFVPDRPTTYHDGIEPYVKLGRLAVLREFRGRGIAGQLIRTAIDWMRRHPTYFNPSPRDTGFERLGMEDPATTGTAASLPPIWSGLFCCHAQESAVKVYEKCGFKVDEKMGRWKEEGIWHVGMFLRVDVIPEQPEI
jgi:predicted GNAT family N-acyltransferase